MTIYKPKRGDTKVEKKNDSSSSTVKIPEDAVWTWFYIIAFVYCRFRVGLKIEIHEIHQNLRNPVSINRPIVSVTCF